MMKYLLFYIFYNYLHYVSIFYTYTRIRNTVYICNISMKDSKYVLYFYFEIIYILTIKLSVAN